RAPATIRRARKAFLGMGILGVAPGHYTGSAAREKTRRIGAIPSKLRPFLPPLRHATIHPNLTALSMTNRKNVAAHIAYDDLRQWLALAELLGEVREVKGASWEEDIGLAAEA